jgi:hypothetical protein
MSRPLTRLCSTTRTLRLLHLLDSMLKMCGTTKGEQVCGLTKITQLSTAPLSLSVDKSIDRGNEQ